MLGELRPLHSGEDTAAGLPRVALQLLPLRWARTPTVARQVHRQQPTEPLVLVVDGREEQVQRVPCVRVIGGFEV